MEMENRFPIVKKGYDPHTVDANISELTAENQFLRGRIVELEKRIQLSDELMANFTRAEDGLRQSIADSKKAAAAMILDAKARSAALLDDARAECGRIVSDLDRAIAGRTQILEAMRSQISQFKAQLFDLYSQHIALMESITELSEQYTPAAPDYTGIAEAVDAFENPGAPSAEVPSFETYPEESIFPAPDSPEDAENAPAGSPAPSINPAAAEEDLPAFAPEDDTDMAASDDDMYAPMPEEDMYASAAEDGEYAPAPEDDMYAPAAEDGEYAPAPEDDIYAPAAEDGEYAPASEDDMFAPDEETASAPMEFSYGAPTELYETPTQPDPSTEHTALFDALTMPTAGAADPDDDFFAGEGESPLGDAVYDFDTEDGAPQGAQDVFPDGEADNPDAEYYQFLTDFINDDIPADGDDN